jgi:peptidyl-prolyl cis-trans isomerase D
MFDFVRKHTKLIQLVMLPMIFVSFVFVGIEGYTRFTDGANASVATVAGSDIKQAEWDAAHRQQVERLRRQMPNVDAKLLDSPEFKRETLEQLLRERVMLVTASKLNLVTGNERLQRQFAADPQYAMLRNADGSVRREVLQAQGMTSEQFAERLRQDLALRQVLGGVTGTVLPAQNAVDAALDALAQQREVQVQRFAAADYRAKVNPSEAEIAAYYGDPAHRDEFMAPESATIEYLVLDLDAIKRDIKPSDEDLRKYYAENEARYTAPAERRASHILVKVDAGASADDKAKAKTEAQSVYDQVKKNPGSFAELAKKHSDDPGSAAKGGDLDFFGRGAMVKPFEDAVFALKPGEIAPLVETDFGYHVIKLDAVRGGEKKGFDAVRAQIENEVKEQLAKQRYAEAAEQFSNLVYEQSDSLQPAADRLKLQVRNATVLRTPPADATGALASDKFLAALFAPDTLTSKRNTEAVETGPNQLAAGRVVKHAPARQLPLDAVKDRVREALVREQSAALARKEGEARLAALAAGSADASTLPAPLKLSRASVGEVAAPVVESALKADATKLPALLGVPLGNEGFAVVRVTKVLGRDTTVVDPARARTQYAQAWSDAEAQAYYAALKTRYAATITAPAAASAAR